MNEMLLNLINTINWTFWDYMIYVLLGAGIYFTVRLGFPQFRRIKDAFLLTFGGLKRKKTDNQKGMSSWQSLATAIAGQIGTGNIVGPATAIAAGGPGAVFWLWVSAFFGMGTIFAEAVAAQKYKTTLSDGTVTGGPTYYIQAAFPNKFGKIVASAFSVFVIIGFGMAAAMVQGNTIADALSPFGVPSLVSGGAVCILLLLVVIGGMGRIAKTTEKLVPIMALFFLATSLVILIQNITMLPEVLVAIVTCAFTPKAALGAATGIAVKMAMQKGVARGLFSNEAGMGSTPHAHAVADVKHPVDQGIVAMMSIVIDTFIVLSITCFVILSTKGHLSGASGIGIIQQCFANTYGSLGPIFIAIIIFFFCFSTIIAAYFYGEQNFKKLFGVKSKPIYMALIIAFAMFGAYSAVELVWAFCDLFNGLMVLTNMIGLIGISGVIVKLVKEYDQGGRTMDTTLNDIKNAKEKK